MVFSATGAIEAQLFKSTGVLTKLSEQNLIDCNKDFVEGNFGCYGGNMLIAYDFIKKNNGISRSSYYPYRGSDIYACRLRLAFWA